MLDYINIIGENLTEELKIKNDYLEVNHEIEKNDYILISNDNEIKYKEVDKPLQHTLIINYEEFVSNISKSFKTSNEIYNQFNIDYDRSLIYVDNINYNNTSNVYDHLKNININDEDILNIFKLSNQAIFAYPFECLQKSLNMNYYLAETKNNEKMKIMINTSLNKFKNIEAEKELRIFKLDSSNINNIKDIDVNKINIKLNIDNINKELIINYTFN